MKITFIDPILCKVEPVKDLQLFKECLGYTSEYWTQGPYGMIRQVGTAYLCDQRNGTFLAGLYPRVMRYCEEYNIQVETQFLLDKIKSIKPKIPDITLRPDQVKMLECVEEHKRGILVAPPGIGKTVLAGALISQYPKSKIVFVVHTKALFSQSIAEFIKWFGNGQIGTIGDGNYLPARINVVMAKTAHSICSKDKEGKFSNPNYKDFFELLTSTDVLIVDETHHAGNQKDGMYTGIFERCLAPIRIGLTATPNTNQKEALVCEGYLGPVIGRLTMEEGQKAGLLAKPKVKLIPVPLNATIAEYRSYQDLYKYGIILNKARNRLIAKEAAERVSNGKSCLIMLVDVIHGQSLSIQKIAKGIYDLDILIVQGSTENDIRERTKKSLQDKTGMAVICTSIWNEGVNLPSLDTVIWAAGGKSDIKSLQGIGRGLRKTADKHEFTVVDFLDPYKYLSGHCIMRLQTYVENGLL